MFLCINFVFGGFFCSAVNGNHHNSGIAVPNFPGGQHYFHYVSGHLDNWTIVRDWN